MALYDVGDMARLGNYTGSLTPSGVATATFTNLAGAATDPTAVTMTVEKPDGTTTVYAWPTPGAGQLTLTRESAGRFYADVELTQAGRWEHRLVGTGAVAATSTGVVDVRLQRVV